MHLVFNRVKMKLYVNGLVTFSILVLAISLAGQAEGNPYCVKQPFENAALDVIVFACVQSTNYMENLEQAPTDVFAITMTNSDIPVLKNRSFARFTDDLTIIGMYDVGLKDIESDAFQGATGVVMIALINNKLEVVKGEWFRDMPHLMTISFENNKIHSIEGSFFTTVKSLDELELYGNQLTDLPRSEFEQFKIDELGIQNNPWSEESAAWLAALIKQKNITEHLTNVHKNVIGDSIILSKNLSTPVSLPTSSVTSEGGETNPALTNVEIHSTDDFCQFINDHPSPFYDCDMDAA